MRTWRSLFLYLFCLPVDIFAFVCLFFIWAIFGKSLRFEKKPIFYTDYDTKNSFKSFKLEPPGNWVLTCEVKSKYIRWCPYNAMTVAPHAILYRIGSRGDSKSWSRVQEHEHVHVEQYEAGGVLGTFLAMFLLIFSSCWFAIIVWLLCPWMYMGASYITSWFRGEDLYYGAAIEEGARAIDDHWNE